MKKNLINIVLGIILIGFITGCTNKRISYISRILEINLDNCQIEKENDTHGGFLGDGDYFAKIVCKDQNNSEIVSKWKPLPLGNELQKAMEIIECNNYSCQNAYQKYSIPSIENGYYYFVDWHSDATDKLSEEELNMRSSYNFSLGMYDSDSKILYYYELDT